MNWIIQHLSRHHPDPDLYQSSPLGLQWAHLFSCHPFSPSDQSSYSVMSDSMTQWTAPCQTSLSIINSQSLLKLMSIKLVMPSNHLILCHPLLLLHSIIPSIRVFSNESALPTSWPKYWNFSFSISHSNAYLGLISFRTNLTSLQSNGLSLSLSLFFNWRIIYLQNFVISCQMATWISHRYIYIYTYIYIYIYYIYIIPPFWASLPSPSPSHPSRLIQSPCLSFLSHTANSHWLSTLHMVICFHVTLSIHVTLSSPLPMSISLFSMSVSPLLSCK